MTHHDVRKGGKKPRIEGDERLAFAYCELGEQRVVGGDLGIHRAGEGSAPQPARRD